MSVLIKDMEMPDNCDVCLFSGWNNLHQTACCKLKKHQAVFHDYSTEYREKRSDMCPLFEASELCGDAEFWRRRADYYCNMCSKLIADMGAGVKIESVKIDETGITFTKKKPPAQSIDLQELEDRFGEYVRFVVNDMLTGEGKRWTR